MFSILKWSMCTADNCCCAMMIVSYNDAITCSYLQRIKTPCNDFFEYVWLSQYFTCWAHGVWSLLLLPYGMINRVFQPFRQEWIISYIKCMQNFSSIGKRIHARTKIGAMLFVRHELLCAMCRHCALGSCALGVAFVRCVCAFRVALLISSSDN